MLLSHTHTNAGSDADEGFPREAKRFHAYLFFFLLFYTVQMRHLKRLSLQRYRIQGATQAKGLYGLFFVFIFFSFLGGNETPLQ
jgi:hypothetical protein